MQVEKESFGALLRESRKEKGMSQADLSELTGFTIRVISLWENGRHDISLKNADTVLKALGATMTIGGEADEPVLQ